MEKEKFEQIWEMQYALNCRTLGNEEYSELTTKEADDVIDVLSSKGGVASMNKKTYDIISSKVTWLQNYLHAMQQEIAEAYDSLPWKWWKKMDYNQNNLKIELIDILHFWISACQVAGMTSDEVYELYMKKNKLNFERQDNGYKEGTYEKVDKDGKEDNEKLFAGLAVRSEDKDKLKEFLSKQKENI